MNVEIAHSFMQQNGMRGIHIYDGNHAVFLPWTDAIEFCQDLLKESAEFEDFCEGLLHAMANVEPDSQYVLVTEENHTMRIECFKHINP